MTPTTVAALAAAKFNNFYLSSPLAGSNNMNNGFSAMQTKNEDVTSDRRVALITGAGSGIGRAISLALARNGFSMALCGRRGAPLQAVADEIKGLGAHALAIPADASVPDAAEKAVTLTADYFGRLDVLVNSAGYAPNVRAPDVTAQQWREILDVNLSSAFYLTRAAWPWLKRSAEAGASGSDARDQRPGCRSWVIYISSQAARDPFPGLAIYGIAKAGLNMLTSIWDREGQPHGIGAFCIAPGAVETEMLRSLFSNEQVAPDDALMPEDVADTVVQCVAGPLRYASGETLYIRRRP